MISPSGFLNASKRFEQLRSIAREVTSENLSEIYHDYASIRLAGIDSEALRCSETWLDHECSRPRAEWSWSEAAKIYRQRHPKRFELSIWYDDKLCGLSYGRPSYASTRMRIELIEGAPRAGNPLGPRRVVPITIMNATAYAGILGAKELRIMRPARALIGYYESLDFTYVESTGAEHFPDYLFKVLR
ncbi:hypothetical protein FHS09_002236 [Microbulbifer rhizosphaerae]|uniref:N-acetyltransferase domain-containing protein n=1 Tax=Microbulbifer rhizosphaerae TaxID=1562603 RepID=A0A7W4WCU6_9GAMM|nr:hypothetical protein [Microbulbifer rhizosphaerae]